MLENNENSINYVWRLINQQNLIGSLGRTTFSMSNLSIVVTTKDIIGTFVDTKIESAGEYDLTARII